MTTTSEVTAEDYARFCGGQRVMVQLMGNCCVAVRGTSEHIEIAERPEVGEIEWATGIAKAYQDREGRAPTEEELRELVRQNPPPGAAVFRPILIGHLRQEGAMLVMRYDSYEERIENGKRVLYDQVVEVTICPDDVKHVSILQSKLAVG